jgi:hypothetical protein
MSHCTPCVALQATVILILARSSHFDKLALPLKRSILTYLHGGRWGWHHDDVAMGLSKESTTWNHRVNNCRTEAEEIPCFCVKPIPRALEMKRTIPASARSYKGYIKKVFPPLHMQ